MFSKKLKISKSFSTKQHFGRKKLRFFEIVETKGGKVSGHIQIVSQRQNMRNCVFERIPNKYFFTNTILKKPMIVLERQLKLENELANIK